MMTPRRCRFGVQGRFRVLRLVFFEIFLGWIILRIFFFALTIKLQDFVCKFWMVSPLLCLCKKKRFTYTCTCNYPNFWALWDRVFINAFDSWVTFPFTFKNNNFGLHWHRGYLCFKNTSCIKFSCYRRSCMMYRYFLKFAFRYFKKKHII